MVPKWYMQAFLGGVSRGKRRDMVQQMCLKEARAIAEEEGAAEPDAVPEELVALMQDMYDHALQLHDKP
ncbi:MAG: hypothetical protein K2Q01_02690 [Rickettsiales bacterium]|nr:hypothetical protein [Rickettsiales bacterium]